MAKISKKREETRRDKLYKRDGRRCHYCRIKEGNFIRIWGLFYGGKTRGRKLGRVIREIWPKRILKKGNERI